MSKLSLRDLKIQGQKVLMRVDFNVPLDKNQNITDDTRIKATLPSIQYVLDQGGALILMSHLGRPKGKPNSSFSLLPVRNALSKLLGKEVLFAEDCVGPATEKMAASLKPGKVLLLENLRFHEAEENPNADLSFAKSLAKLGDVYVDDAFGSAHRAHASIDAVARLFKGKAAAGFLMEKEIKFLGDVLKDPKRPFCTILGGAKISSKCGVIESLMKKADVIMIGGAMAYTFLKAQGIKIGNSLCEDDFLQKAEELLKMSGKGCAKIILPKDLIIAKEIKSNTASKIVNMSDGIPDGYEGVSIGPETVKEFTEELNKAKTVLWNGPLGVFEIPEFAESTNTIAHILANLKATTIVGGGDSLAAVNAAKVGDKITHLSTGGGASLEYIEHGTLPGIEVLTEKLV